MSLLLLILLIASLIISAISKAIMDVVACCYSSSVFKNLNPLFWDKSQSWRNKWKGGDPSKGERFPGSSTIFVSFTDAWHLFQHFFLFFMFASFIFYSQSLPLIAWAGWYGSDFILIYAGYCVIFQIFYSLFTRKK